MHAPLFEEPDCAMDFTLFGGWLFPVGGGDFCVLFVFFGGMVLICVKECGKVERGVSFFVWNRAKID